MRRQGKCPDEIKSRLRFRWLAATSGDVTPIWARRWARSSGLPCHQSPTIWHQRVIFRNLLQYHRKKLGKAWSYCVLIIGRNWFTRNVLRMSRGLSQLKMKFDQQYGFKKPDYETKEPIHKIHFPFRLVPFGSVWFVARSLKLSRVWSRIQLICCLRFIQH
jgi:hypothetical protein